MTRSWLKNAAIITCFFENGEIIEYGTWSERTINRIRDYFDIGTFGHV